MVVVVHLRVHHAVLGEHGAATDRHRAVAKYLDPLAESRAVAYRRVAAQVNPLREAPPEDFLRERVRKVPCGAAVQPASTNGSFPSSLTIS